ncbi:hypothetical protein AAFC00_003122 [Neodothiora populina]|uniref:Maf-like protein n=1 Tax=Neodothiora populina TaxID=2781224 RepID=A0ABR3P9C7_9PEZI
MSDVKIPLDDPPTYESAAEHVSLLAGQAPPPTRPVSIVKGGPGPRLPLPLDIPSLRALRGRRVILASASPRRKQLLAQIGLTDIEIIPSTLPEDLSKSLTPFEYVLQTAEQKAMHVYRSELDSPRGEPALVLAADTVVVSSTGEILEKPRSEKEHIAVLKGLRNSKWHKVYTAVVCMAPREDAADPGYVIKTHCEETNVKFDSEVTDDLILAYVKTREGADKAGGYGIQGMGAILVERVNGDYGNIVGLPLRPTLKLIEQVMNPGIASDGEEEEE